MYYKHTTIGQIACGYCCIVGILQKFDIDRSYNAHPQLIRPETRYTVPIIHNMTIILYYT